MPRKPFIGGNWKSNGTVESTKTLCAALSSGAAAYGNKVEVVVTPILPQLNLTQKLLRKTAIKVGAQNVSASKEGAFTGEVSAGQLKDARVSWTLIGHSERRTKYGETDAITAEKVEMCQATGISVIFCIGESLEEREAGKTDEVNKRQLTAVFDKIKDWKKIVIAYEPVWAIGTGKVATPDMAQESHAAIRKIVSEAAGEEVANGVRILYGGSVTPDNCKELIAKADIDGFLVGGASLKPTFNDIIVAAVPPPVLKKPKFQKVDGLKPEARGVNTFLKVLKEPSKVEASEELREVLAGDDSGCVILTVRADKADICKVGTTLRVQNAHVAMIKGYMRLTVDKWAVIKAADAEGEVKTVKEDKNISSVQYTLE
mmetsp:Transcript_36741/g.79596  ORF Transcript_36741/g.79596 Transcript_36741/m.79596 type:complete len:373 (+) Transcript_36741:90-1208(+)